MIQILKKILMKLIDKDVFRLDRVTSDPDEAHKSNFLHPVFYYFEELPESNVDILKRATKIHHMLEDFLTFWTDIRNHQTYLQQFFEHIFNLDLNVYSKSACVKSRLISNTYPFMCKLYFQ